MRTQVIPAQITTVEDRIAGNLNFTQIFILMIPIFYTTLDYAVFWPQMHVTAVKIVTALLVLVMSILLSLRIKGKVVANWMIIILAYNLRPKYYVCNKNHTYLRNLDLIPQEKRQQRLTTYSHAKKQSPQIPEYGIEELLQLERLVENSKLGLRFRSNRKGGMNVAFNEIK